MRAPSRDLPSGAELSPHRDVTALFERLAPARARLAQADERVLRTQIALSEIPAPTGDEHARGASVAARFRALGLQDVATDDVGNVTGWRRGATIGAPVLICAHLDTVFPEGTAVGVARDGRQLAGPGIVDNSRGLAAMLALEDRKSTRLNSSHLGISYAVFCLKKKKKQDTLRSMRLADAVDHIAHWYAD